MDSIPLKTKELVAYYSGCHGNLVTIATRHVADALSMPNMNSIQFKTNELLMFHSGCHGNQVSIVTIKWLMPIAPITSIANTNSI